MKIPAARALRASFAALALPAIAGAAIASDLTLNGGLSAEVPYGTSVQIAFTGMPGKPAIAFLDVSPGPVLFAGELVPIGATPLLTLLYATAIPASGTSVTNFPIPLKAGLAGKSFYIAAVVSAPGDPNGLDFSNNALLSIAPPAGAGENTTTLVGRATALDGSDAADPSGGLPAGTSIFWELLSQPAGSVASLALADTLFPVLKPDVRGDYVVRQTVSAGGASLQDTTTVHAYSLSLPSPPDGQWVNSPLFAVIGNVQGPSLGSLSLGGVPVAVQPGGDFGPIVLPFGAGEVIHPLTFELVDADGTDVRERFTLGQGVSAPLSQAAPRSLAAHLNQGGLDLLEASAAAELAAVDIQSLLTSLGAQQIANDQGPFGFTIFSATILFKSLTFDKQNVTVILTPTSSGLQGFVSLKNVKAVFDVWGEVLEIGYSLSGEITSSPVDISGLLTFGASGGQLTAGISGVSVIRHNFDFNLNGFLGDVAELFVIESAVKEDVENAIAQTVSSELPSAIAELLNQFEITGNLFELIEVDVQVSAPITGVVHVPNGITVQLDTLATVGVAEPGAPAVTTYRKTTSAPPGFGPTTPAGGLAYDAALAAADDFLNQVLAAATGAGLLNGDPSTLLEPDGSGQSPADLLVTDALALLFPGAGFDHFPSGTQVSLRSFATMPPVVHTTPGGPSIAVVEIADLVLDFSVPVPGGSVPLLSVSLDGSAALSLSIAPDGTLLVAISDVAIEATPLRGFPGANLNLIQAGIDFLKEFLLPSLTEGLEAIPIPELSVEGLGVAPSEVGLTGGLSEYVGFYGGLVLTSPAP